MKKIRKFRGRKIVSLFIVVCLLCGIGMPARVLATEGSSVVNKLTASDGAAGDMYGCSVAISGNKVVVGAYGDDDDGSGSGSVYIYDLSSDDVEGTKIKLTASDGEAYDRYGKSVAISGDKVVVGAYYDDDNGWESGSVYIYDLSSGDVDDIKESEIKLTASDGASWDYYGCSVAISGDKVVVGAVGDDDKRYDSGSVYIYDLSSGDRDDIQGSEKKLTASDGAAWDMYGCSVAISGNKVIIGACGDDDNVSDIGSVYIYDLSSGDLDDIEGSEKKLTASDGAADDRYGYTVAISGNKVVVGAYGDDDKGSFSGSVYMYDLSSDDVSDIQGSQKKLTASDGAADDHYGYTVAILGNKVVVGAYGDDDKGSFSGSVYIYDLSSDDISDIEGSEIKLTTSDGADEDSYGSTVAISGNKVVVGSYGDDDNGEYSGSVYYYGNTITLNNQDGVGGTSSIMVIVGESMPTATAPTREGYTFGGYFTGQNGTATQYYYADMTSAINWDINSDTTLYAKWTGNTYTVAFDHQGGTGQDLTTVTYGNSMPTATAPTRERYTFGGYFTGESGTGAQYYNADMTLSRDWDIASDTTLYAKWTYNNTIPNRISTVEATTSSTITVGDAYEVDLTTIFEDSDGDNLTYKVSVNGLDEVTASQMYSYTATSEGVMNLRFTANDGLADSGDTYFVQLITENAPPNVLVGMVKIVDDTTPQYGETLTAEVTGDNNTGTLSYQWKRGSDEVGTDSNTYTITVDDIGEDITVEVTSYEEVGSLISSNVIIPDKAEYTGSVIEPEESIITDNSIVLKNVEGYEYKESNTGWQDINIFTGLSAETAYTFIQRVKATETHYESTTSGAIKITTEKDDDLTNTDLDYINISDGFGDFNFSAGQTVYTIDNPNNLKSIHVITEAVNSKASIQVNEEAYTGGNKVPVALETGTNLIQIEVTSENGEEDKTYLLYIEVIQDLAIRTNKLPLGMNGINYESYLLAEGGEGDYTWICTQLPEGLSFDEGSGLISGTPDVTVAEGEKTVTLAVTFTVTDEVNTTETITLDIEIAASCGKGAYLISPEENESYDIIISDALLPEIHINDNTKGFSYFTVDISKVDGHSGNEVVVFVHYRDNEQIGISAVEADFDREEVYNAKAAFNVQSGDVIKVFIVDELNNDTDDGTEVL